MLTETLLDNFLTGAGVALNGNRPYDIRIHDDRFYNELHLYPSIAAGEGYMAGYWDCDQIDELFYRICRYEQYDVIYPKWVVALRKMLNTVLNHQSLSRSRQVAEQHYNLGNDFYRYMLGKSMAYTCAYWKDASILDEAQSHKFDLICRKIGLKPGERVLDLGCGWGSLAKFMAEKYRCDVTAVNISSEQVRFAQDICEGLPVHVHLCDYRDSHLYNPDKQPFDKIVSVGLCEHVGYKNYGMFLKVARENIKEDGLFLLHTIGKSVSGNFVDPWINKYIFPNGVLPSIKNLSEAAENQFIIEDLHNFGADYDKTLMAWHKNFNENWFRFKDQYGETFFRLWNYYLLTCAGGFRARAMQLWQLVLSPKGVSGGYESIR